MGYLAKIIGKNQTLANLILKLFIKLEEFSLKIINVLAIQANHGFHPKYQLTKYTDFFVKNITAKDTVLDIGCGTGFVAHTLAQKASKVTGIDIKKESLEKARQTFKKENLEYLLADATNYAFTEHYDCIVLSNVLEHIENRQKFLQSIKKIAPKILIRVPMINRDWLPLYKKQLGLFPFSDAGHFIEYTLESFQEELAQAQLQIESQSIQFGEIWAVVKTS